MPSPPLLPLLTPGSTLLSGFLLQGLARDLLRRLGDGLGNRLGGFREKALQVFQEALRCRA